MERNHGLLFNLFFFSIDALVGIQKNKETKKSHEKTKNFTRKAKNKLVVFYIFFIFWFLNRFEFLPESYLDENQDLLTGT